MSKLLAVVCCLTSLVLSGSVAYAQVDEPSPSVLPSHVWPAESIQPPTMEPDTEDRLIELRAWMVSFIEWQDWAARVGNDFERGWLTSHRARRKKPIPPNWLPDRCAILFDVSGPVASACTLLSEWNEDPSMTRARAARNAARADLESPTNQSWWEHLHVDLLWPAMQWKTSVYGVIGMHTAVDVKGRWQVFLTPGAMLLNLPSSNGSRTWKLATNYGVGYRLTDFTFFGGRPASLYVNFAKAWLLSDASDVALGKTTDFIGFSMTFRKSR